MHDRDRLAVLLVEDNPGDANLVRHHLERGQVAQLDEEVYLTHVEDLSTALDALEQQSYDLVLLDLGLPESTGLATLEQVTDVVDDVPIVVLTGLDDTDTALEAIQGGAQDYLPKNNLDENTLIRSLRYAVEREKQARELRRRTEQLEFFHSILRHDVQNGMDVIRSNAQLLEADLSADNRDRAKTIVDWSNDIIDLTQSVRRMLDTVAGDQEDRLEPVALGEILRDQATTVEGMGQAVTVELSVPDNIAVVADEMFDEVLGNVMTNAVEHNDTDEPRLDVTVSESDGVVVIEIADNGPGFPTDQREQLLGRGEKGLSSDGTGFGLYFVATMVDSYGGTLDISDNDPRGAVFTIELPAA